MIERKAKQYMTLQTRGIFYKLSYDDQVYLLRETENITSQRYQLCRNLAAKLDIPVSKLYSWMKLRRQKLNRLNSEPSMKISPVKTSLLTAEFARDQSIDADKVLLLSFLFNIHKKAILRWYSKHRSQYKHKETAKVVSDKTFQGTPIPTTNLYGNQKKSPAQLSILFETYKKLHGKVKGTAIDELMAQTDLSYTSIRGWLKGVNRKLKINTKSEVIAQLRQDFNSSQIRQLQKEYQKRKYITQNEAEEIAKSVSTVINKVMQWFNQRRIYELISAFDSNKGQQPLNKVFEPNTPGMKHVVIQKSANQKRNVSITPSQVLKLLKEGRRLNNRKNWPAITKKLDLTIKQLNTWVNNKKYRELKIQKAKSIYGKNLKKNQRQEKFTPKQQEFLEKKYNEDDYITKKRAESIAKQLRVPKAVNRVFSWFEAKRIEDTAKKLDMAVPTTSSALTSSGKNFIYSSLFEEYKASSQLLEARLEEISERLGIDKVMVKGYFSNLNKGLKFKNKAVIEDSLMKKCDDHQRAILEKAYCRSKYHSKAYIEKLSAKLGMTQRTVAVWFVNARKYELLTGEQFKSDLSVKEDDVNMKDIEVEPSPSNLAWPCILKLKEEFKKNPIMTDNRARKLAIKFKIRANKIKAWFESRQLLVMENNGEAVVEGEFTDYEVSVEEEKKEFNQEEVQTEMRSFCLSIPKIDVVNTQLETNTSTYHHELPDEKEALFKEFLKSPDLDEERTQELCSRLSMSKKQIDNWFCWLKMKVNSVAEKIMSDKYRNKDLNSEQVEILEAVFQAGPYPEIQERYKLAERLNVGRGIIKTWFANRRYYEIVKNNENASPINSTTDFHPVIKSVSSVCADDEIDVHEEILFDWLPMEDEISSHDNLLHEIIEVHSSDVPVPAQYEFIDRVRHIEPLTSNLELTRSDNVNNLFWYVNQHPDIRNQKACSLSDSDVVILEGMYESCPQPDQMLIHEFAKRLQVSEQTVYWWFMQQRFRIKSNTTGSLNSIIKNSESAPVNKIQNEVDEIIPGNHSSSTDIQPENDQLSIKNEDVSINEKPISTERSLPKKKKTNLSSHQRAMLIQEFQKSQFVSKLKTRMLANDLCLSAQTVEKWFVKKRQLLGIVDQNGGLEDALEPLTPNQLVTLELEYRLDPKLTKTRLQELAIHLQAQRRSVFMWFKERKQKVKKVESHSEDTVNQEKEDVIENPLETSLLIRNCEDQTQN